MLNSPKSGTAERLQNRQLQIVQIATEDSMKKCDVLEEQLQIW